MPPDNEIGRVVFAQYERDNLMLSRELLLRLNYTKDHEKENHKINIIGL